MKLYLAVTYDEFELPLMVTSNVQELADRFGKTKHQVLDLISKNSSGFKEKIKFIRIEVEEGE